MKLELNAHYWAHTKENNPQLLDKMCIKIGIKKVFHFRQAGGSFDRNLGMPKRSIFPLTISKEILFAQDYRKIQKTGNGHQQEYEDI